MKIIKENNERGKDPLSPLILTVPFWELWAQMDYR